jgi:AraC-like DNA-binding protein
MIIDKLLTNLSVQVSPFAICTLSPGWRLRLPGPAGVLFHFVLEGEGVLYGPNGDAHKIAPYHLSAVPIGAKHVIETSGQINDELRIDAPPEGDRVCEIVAGSKNDADLVIACGIVNVQYGSSMDLFRHLTEILSVDLTSVTDSHHAFQRIIEEQSQAIAGSEAMTAALMLQCLVHFFRRLPSQSEEALPWLMALQDERLGRVVDMVLDEPGADYSVESMADIAAMSRSSFTAAFMKSFGRSPMSFVNHTRMQHAALLLAGDNTSVDEIARTVGYSSRSHFSRAFKSHSGLPPAEFRAEQLAS